MPCRMNYSNTTTALRRGMLEPFDDRTLSYNNKIRSHFIGRHRLDALIDINEEKRIQSGAIKLFTPMSLWILFNFINYDILSQWNLFSKFISIKSEFQFNKNLNVTWGIFITTAYDYYGLVDWKIVTCYIYSWTSNFMTKFVKQITVA